MARRLGVEPDGSKRACGPRAVAGRFAPCDGPRHAPRAVTAARAGDAGAGGRGRSAGRPSAGGPARPRFRPGSESRAAESASRARRGPGQEIWGGGREGHAQLVPQRPQVPQHAPVHRAPPERRRVLPQLKLHQRIAHVRHPHPRPALPALPLPPEAQRRPSLRRRARTVSCAAFEGEKGPIAPQTIYNQRQQRFWERDGVHLQRRRGRERCGVRRRARGRVPPRATSAIPEARDHAHISDIGFPPPSWRQLRNRRLGRHAVRIATTVEDPGEFHICCSYSGAFQIATLERRQ
jgi:hypothetical protein